MGSSANPEPGHLMNQHFLLSAAACVLISSAAAAQRDPIIREGVTVKLGPHTYAIPDDWVSMVPNVGIVVGSRATLVIDPGMGRQNGETVLREAAKLSKNTELYVVSTHYHPEHTTGYLAFPSTARYVNSTVQEAEFAELGMGMIERFAGFTPVTAELLKGVTRRVADITFDREHRLDLGGVAVRMVVVGPTHTRGDTGFFVEGDGVLFAGDVVMNESFLAANQASSTTAWLKAFDTFDTFRPTTLVPAHGPIGSGAVIATQRTIVSRIQARARELKAQGRSADEVATTVQKEVQAEHPQWPRASGIAALARSAWNEAP